MYMLMTDDERGLRGMVGNLPIKIGTRVKFANPLQIMYVRARGAYVDVAMSSGEILHTKEPISLFENRLPAYLFARIHRSYIVNIDHVQAIRTRHNDYDLLLTDGTSIASGGSYRQQLRELFLMSRRSSTPPDGRDIRVPEPARGNRAHQVRSRLRVRACAPGDERSLALLGQTTFIENYAEAHEWPHILAHCSSHHSPGFYRSWLEDRQTHIWMLETELTAAPIGYVALTPAKLPVAGTGEGDLEIQRIYLLQQYRDRELCGRMLTEALQHAQREGCRCVWVADDAENGRRLGYFEHAGFNPRDEYRRQVGGGEYSGVALSMQV